MRAVPVTLVTRTQPLRSLDSDTGYSSSNRNVGIEIRERKNTNQASGKPRVTVIFILSTTHIQQYAERGRVEAV
jgi:hypothetical protein